MLSPRDEEEMWGRGDWGGHRERESERERGRKMSWVIGHHLLSIPFQPTLLPHHSVSSNGGTLGLEDQPIRPLVLNVFFFFRQASATYYPVRALKAS